MRAVEKISLAELKEMAQNMYGSIVKADVDIKRRVVVVDMGMHADGEAFLLEDGSKKSDVWGINLHPADYGTNDFIEFDSIINIRPKQNNPSRDILDEEIKKQISELINEVVYD